jgi:RNA polymerase sigma-70 factor, ECF subfamily
MSAWEVGRAAWPGVALPRERFEAFLRARAIGDDTPHAADLYLACACLDAVPAALAAFERTLLAATPAYVARLSPTAEFIEELKQATREKLFVGPAPRLAEYAGTGPLGAWLRVVVARLAIDARRKAGGEPLAAREPVELAMLEPSPELQALRNRYRPLFANALREALAALTVDERNLLRLHFVDGVSMDELGKLHRVNRSTIHRRIAQCTAALNRDIRARVGEALSLSTGELDSLTRLIESDLEISLGGLLRSRSD